VKKETSHHFNLGEFEKMTICTSGNYLYLNQVIPL